MTTQRPEQAIWPITRGDVPALPPGGTPAVAPVPPISSAPAEFSSSARRVTGLELRSRLAYLGLALTAIVVLATGAAIVRVAWPSGSVSRRTAPAPISPSADHAAKAGGAFGQRQAAANRSRFRDQEASEFAEPWLSRVGDCTADTGVGGPRPGVGEASRTRCAAGIITTYWISYRSIADRERALARNRQHATAAWQLTPGASSSPGRERPGDSRVAQYVEYAYVIPTGQRAGQIVAAIWYSDPVQPVAGVFLAYWSDGLGSSWEPLRDFWRQRD